MSTPVTLDDWLSALYMADVKGKLAAEIIAFQAAMAGLPDLQTAAQNKLVELNGLIAARGEGACAYSTKYWNYLKASL